MIQEFMFHIFADSSHHHHVVTLTEGAAIKIPVRHQPAQLPGAAVSQEDGVDEQAEHVRDRVPHLSHGAREGVRLKIQ